MSRTLSRNAHRQKIHRRIRFKIRGTSERPRLCVYRSLRGLYAQLVDDDAGRTLLAVMSRDQECSVRGSNNLETAKQVGMLLARRAKEKGIENVVFDRAGYLYHGRIRALADSARETGLKF
ncbi:MAG: 50S ribosomal protein L18 [Acidobacteriota bacterium]|nr:50S ribosomal protein L18 [Acidobacteriota bacterium]